MLSQRVRRASGNNLAVVYDHDVIRTGRLFHIVRREENGHVVFFLEGANRLPDIFLGLWIKARGRLV